MITEQIKEQLCHSCYNELELIIESKEKLKGKLITMVTGEIIPTFNIEFDDESEIEYNAYWVCKMCKTRSYEANKDLIYDEVNDTLIYPAYDADTKLGHVGPAYQPPFGPDINHNPIKEEKLPIIVKASLGGISEVTDPLMEGYGWD